MTAARRTVMSKSARKFAGVSKIDVRNAFKLHKAFREPLATDRVKVRRVKVNIPTALMVQGTVESINYRTTHGGEAVLYKHEFAPGSRPFLASGPKRNQAFLIGGRYHVTERGIVDLDANGNEIEDASGEPIDD